MKNRRTSDSRPWGLIVCSWCDEPTCSDGTLACKCIYEEGLGKMLYRLEPAAPMSAMKVFHVHRIRGPDPLLAGWSTSKELFKSLSKEERSGWQSRAAHDLKRYEKEKMEYNRSLDLDADVLTDHESESQHECGNGWWEERKELQRRRCEQLWTRYRQDHPRFSKIDKSSCDVTKPYCFHKFSQLPAEIRDQIYSHVFHVLKSEKGLRQWQLLFESKDCDPELRFTDLRPLDTRILAVNRQVYSEALDILYSSNSFVVDVARGSALPIFITKSSGIETPRPVSRIKRWHVRLSFVNTDDRHIISSQLNEICKVMGQCLSLEEVRFTWITVPHYWSEIPQLVREYDEMLEIFATIRGVGHVEFTDKFSDSEEETLGAGLDGFSVLHLGSEEKTMSVKSRMESTEI